MNVTEIKNQIFPRYIGSDAMIVCRDDSQTGYEDGIQKMNGFIIDWPHEFKSVQLILNPLESITDEDLNKVSDFIGSFNPEYFVNYLSGKQKQIYFVDSTKGILAYQYLQLKSYALPQLVILEGKSVTLSVTQQIELNIIKIRK